MRSFAVIFYGGSGSSWLVHTLSSAPEVVIPAYEPLESWHWDASDAEKLAWLDAAFSPPAERDAWVTALSRSPQFQGLRDGEFSVVGLKMTPEAISDHASLLDLFARHGTTLVFLSRANRVKHALSLYRMHEEQRDQFNPDRAAEPTRLRMRKFDHWLARAEAWHELQEAFRDKAGRRLAPSSLVDLTYESFTGEEGKDHVVAWLSTVLGLRSGTITHSRYRKATPDRISDAVVNYRRLCRHLRGSRHEAFLDPEAD